MEFKKRIADVHLLRAKGNTMKHTDSWQERVSVFKLYLLGLRKKRRKIMKQQKKNWNCFAFQVLLIEEQYERAKSFIHGKISEGFFGGVSKEVISTVWSMYVFPDAFRRFGFCPRTPPIKEVFPKSAFQFFRDLYLFHPYYVNLNSPLSN